MRTSIVIPDELMEQIKIRCIKEKTTFTKVVNELLSGWVGQEEVQIPSRKPKKEVPTSFSKGTSNMEVKPNKWLFGDDED
jgi:hypothetical protein